MQVSSRMCHTSWVQVILTNSAWSSSWPVGWVQPLCEVFTWPVTFSLQETGNRCSFSKCSLLHLPSLGRWVASWKGHQEGQTSPWGLSAPPPGSCRCCCWTSHNTSVCATVCLSQSCTLFHMILCAWKAPSSLTNRTKVCCYMDKAKCNAFAVAYWLNHHVEKYFCKTFLVLLFFLVLWMCGEQCKAKGTCMLMNAKTFGWRNSAEQYIYFAFLNGSN